MINVSTHWRSIGRHFHISAAALKKSRYNSQDPDVCLVRTLVEWLKNWRRPPTWKKVVCAVAAVDGGNDPREAEKIGNQYRSKLGHYFVNSKFLIGLGQKN